MTITRTFTNGPDSFAVRTSDSYDLSFLGGDDTLVILSGTTTAHMGDGNDFVRVSSGAATLFGDAGADRFDLYASGTHVDGGDGNDLVNIRGGGNHLLAGGAGDDRFNFLSGASGETLHGGDGNDLFVGSGMSVGGAIFGDAGNDRFYDFANVGGRSVTLYGGLGNDTYRVTSASAPAIVEHAGEGTDTVQLGGGLDYTLGANVENMQVLGWVGVSQVFDLTGNDLANRIVGNENDEHIVGGGGNDALYGKGGNDTISGGDGNDRIFGGTGADTLEGGAGADRFVYTSGADAAGYDLSHLDFIADWQSIDRIDLSAIDADPTTPGDQAFEVTSVLFGAPSGPQPAGSVVLGGFGGELYVLVYINGGDEPDMNISLWSQAGESALTPNNLIL